MTHNPDTCILLTRPAAQAQAYADELGKACGDNFIIVQSPLLEIEILKVPLNLSGVHHLLFTSVNGVNAFAENSDQRDIPTICVGSRTAKAATAIGLKAAQAQGTANDMIALAQELAQGLPGEFLYLRGRIAAQGVSSALNTAGYTTRETVIYSQNSQNLNQSAIKVLTNQTRILVPLFSPRTAELFTAQTAGIHVQNAKIICLSQNVADRLGDKFASEITVVSKPTAAAVTREIAASL